MRRTIGNVCYDTNKSETIFEWTNESPKNFDGCYPFSETLGRTKDGELFLVWQYNISSNVLSYMYRQERLTQFIFPVNVAIAKKWFSEISKAVEAKIDFPVDKMPELEIFFSRVNLKYSN